MLNKNVTCIDPDPKLYDAPQVWIEPTFKTVDDIPQNLLKTFNYAMIIWPYPENKVRYNSYDYKALEKLLGFMNPSLRAISLILPLPFSIWLLAHNILFF